jgi:hypothetical protein
MVFFVVLFIFGGGAFLGGHFAFLGVYSNITDTFCALHLAYLLDKGKCTANSNRKYLDLYSN